MVVLYLILNQNESIGALLLKNKAINKRFFYGVTATLIYYALDPDRNKKVPADSDEFFILNTDSKYIAMSEVLKCIDRPTLVHFSTQ
jgi:hypothetical protein